MIAVGEGVIGISHGIIIAWGRQKVKEVDDHSWSSQL